MRPEKGIQEHPISLSAVSAGDGSISTIDLRQATKAETWAQINRLLMFEEPAAKAQRANQLTSRHSNVTTRQFNGLCHKSQIEIFNLTYGSSDQTKFNECRLLNTLLALEDVFRFQSLSFQVWLRATTNGDNDAYGEFINWADEAPLNIAEAAWLYQAANAVPNFSMLYEDGPWQSDSRVEFIIAVLNDFAKFKQNFSYEQLKEAKLIFDYHLAAFRHKLSASFLPNLICLVEGPTEEILLPHFAQILGVNFHQAGVLVTPSGGAKQEARRFLELRDLTTIPLVAVLDRDANEEAEVIAEMLRDKDKLHVLSAGEIEDIYDTGLFIELINKYLGSIRLAEPVKVAEIEYSKKRTATIADLWRARGLGDFDKIGFAKSVAATTLSKQAVPADAIAIVKSIQHLLSNNVV